MAELRRLLIDQQRLQNIDDDNRLIPLSDSEMHYLSKVLRFRTGDELIVINGIGKLWKASFTQPNSLRLHSLLHDPHVVQHRKKPLLCLAIVLPKQGFDQTLRMCTEIGIDVFQPLISEYSLYKDVGSTRFQRWESILGEAVEQSERLWKPQLKSVVEYSDWISHCPSNSCLSIGTTRLNKNIKFESWLNKIPANIDHVWIVIGPEGGWTNKELLLVENKKFKKVSFGETILRTSTAAISASQLMASWRRMRC